MTVTLEKGRLLYKKMHKKTAAGMMYMPRQFNVLISYISVFLLLRIFSYALRWVSRNVLFYGSPAGFLPSRSFS